MKLYVYTIRFVNIDIGRMDFAYVQKVYSMTTLYDFIKMEYTNLKHQ